MWRSLFVVAAVASCTPAAPTDPALIVQANDPGRWFESEPLPVSVEWPGADDCASSDWTCSGDPLPLFSITSATCSGCTLRDVPTGTRENIAVFTLVATSTDVIDLAVTVESGGAVRMLAASAMGDREASLRVDCEVIRTETLHTSELHAADFAPCRATHTAAETVVLAPSITTVHGISRFPFCSSGGTLCTRDTSQILFTGAAVEWGDGDFVVLADATAAHQVTVTAPLADGTRSTATVATPALAH